MNRKRIGRNDLKEKDLNEGWCSRKSSGRTMVERRAM